MENRNVEYENEVFGIMQLLIEKEGNIVECNQFNENVLSLAYDCQNKKYFQFIVKSVNKFSCFSNLTTKKLLYIMMTNKDWDNLKLVLEQSSNSENDDEFILNLAIQVLKKNELEISKLIISKCINKNIRIKKGETFLTYLFKEDFQESVIVDLISNGVYDLSMTNKLGESPLVLAENKKMFNAVSVISHLITEISNESKRDESDLERSCINPDSMENFKSDVQIINGKKSPYVSTPIPIENRIFKEIDLNTPVKVYYPSTYKLLDLFGKVAWTGMDKSGNYLYGIEIDNAVSYATNGTFDGQELFQCNNNQGILVPINYVALDTTAVDAEPEEEKLKISEVSTEKQFTLPIRLHKGWNCGIQGNASSSFFDAIIFALFSHSEVLDSVFCHEFAGVDKTTRQIKDIFCYNIVYPLREFGYVSYDKIETLKSVLKTHGQKFLTMTDEETDIDNSLTFLSKFCSTEQLLSFISYHNHKTQSMYIKLFGQLTELMICITSQEMLNMSMVQNEIMFNTLPSCLIMHIPMNSREEFSSIYFIPLKTIDISQVSIVYFKKCVLCNQEAKRQCRVCFEKSKFCIKSGFYCQKHWCDHEEMLILPQLEIKSKSRSLLHLKAIICYEKHRYVTFLKHSDFDNKWIRFDNMTTKNKYSPPKVSISEDLSKFFSQSDKNIMDNYMDYSVGDNRLILKDACVLIYYNPSVTCN